jgi:hypothetical protein
MDEPATTASPVIDEAWRRPDGKYTCPLCSRVFFRKNLILHLRRAHTTNGRPTTRRRSTNRKYKNIKQGWFRGFWCDSGWELAFLLYHFDHGIRVERNEKGFPYIYRKRKRWYYPDFLLDGDIFVEVKGIVNARVRAKTAAFPFNLHVYGPAEMKPILAYVEGKYGKEYASLLVQDKDESMKL